MTDKNVDDITIGEVGKYLGEEFRNEYLKDKKEIIDSFYSNKNFKDITLKELRKI